MRPVTIIIPDDKIKIIGILHFIHGMQEHRKRYDHVLEYFSRMGYICAISDTRGHGENVTSKEDLGHIPARGATLLVEDVVSFNEYLKKIYPGLPIILIGHSMGSLIARAFAKKHSYEIDAMIICGSPSRPPLTDVGKAVLKFIAFFKGWRYKSAFFTKHAVDVYNKPFEKDGLNNAWICSDGNVVDAFNNDELCGFPFTLSGYRALLNLVSTVYSGDGWKKINKELPIMFISGGDDSVRINDKRWQESVNHLKSVGFHNIFSKMYPGMRHELFNEIGKEEVYMDILKFLEINLGLEADIY